MTCGGCSTRYHSACVDELGSCGTLGCEGTIQPSAERRERTSSGFGLRHLLLFAISMGVPALGAAALMRFPDHALEILGFSAGLPLLLFVSVTSVLAAPPENPSS